VENVWISRISIEIARPEAQPVKQFGVESPPNLKQTLKGESEGSPKESRKADRKEAERTLQGGIEGWERAPQGARDRSGLEAPF
jgi:hypothetical protein